MSAKLDITNKTELSRYLMKKGISVKSHLKLRVLGGGVSAEAIYAETDPPIVAKQSLARLKTASDWYSDTSRIKVEYLGLDWLNRNLPSGSVPAPILLDESNHLLIMEGIAPPVRNLKSMLLNEEIDDTLMESFGRMLGTIHEKGRVHPENKDTFSNRDFFITLRLEPYYEFTGKQIPESFHFYEHLIQATLDHQITIVHGDYSPKNVLVKEQGLILLDHEVMHFGDPAFDVGFSLTHLLSKANHLQNQRFIDLALLVWNNYRSEFSYNENGFEQRCVYHLLGCMLARVHGKSPLEYLNETSREWQSKTVLQMIGDPPATLQEAFNFYKNAFNDKN